MKYPSITWLEPNSTIQAQHLCFLAKTIEQGGFQKGGYWVLPYLVPDVVKAVFFPDFEYSPEYWRIIKKTSNLDLCKPYPAKAVQEAIQRLANMQTDYADLQTQWQAIEARFFSYCLDFLILHECISSLQRIELYVSPYGTSGSYDYKKEGSGEILMIVMRSDTTVSRLIELLLMAFWTRQTRKRAEIYQYHWLNKMATIEFLMHNTVFSTLAPAEPTPKTISIETLARDSSTYLKKLGFDLDPAIRLTAKGLVLSDGTGLENYLTAQEQQVLSLMITQPNEIIDYDQIGMALWGKATEDKFSLYAIAKVIENIRKKLHDLGLYRELIHTVRKRGYLFTN